MKYATDTLDRQAELLQKLSSNLTRLKEAGEYNAELLYHETMVSYIRLNRLFKGGDIEAVINAVANKEIKEK